LKKQTAGRQWRVGVLPYNTKCKVRKVEFLLGVSCPTVCGVR